jgi:kynurenine 3-monooxygenase
MAQAVMMRGRMVHALDGAQQLQRYGRDDSEVIWSVHRGRLNIALLEAAEAAGARIHFNQRLDSVDFERRVALFVNDHDRTARPQPFEALLGADGAGSGLREAMRPRVGLGERFEPLGHGYKELEIPPAADGGFRIEPHALHIWPRGGYMCIALPNTEKTFTVTLFLPMQGEPSFHALPDLASARAFFERDFADALPLLPDFDADWTDNPVSGLGTLSLQRWHLNGRAVLLGDAAHAMVPFHGQGMNCAFEDCLALDRHIASAPDFETAFAGFEAERKPNADAIQAMALENYVEMRDRVDDADFLLQRQLEVTLAERHPGRFLPRYSMVSFTCIPYATAFERGKVQRQILVESTQGCATLAEVDLAAADARVRERLAPL